MRLLCHSDGDTQFHREMKAADYADIIAAARDVPRCQVILFLLQICYLTKVLWCRPTIEEKIGRGVSLVYWYKDICGSQFAVQ